MGNQSDAQRSLIKADDQRCRAMLAHDLDALAALLADDVVYTHSSAVVENKQQYLATLREGRTRYLDVRRQNAHIRLYGPVAVMHGRVIMKIDTEGGQKDLNNLFQSVWIERDGRWLLASWASTVIPS